MMGFHARSRHGYEQKLRFSAEVIRVEPQDGGLAKITIGVPPARETKISLSVPTPCDHLALGAVVWVTLEWDPSPAPSEETPGGT